MKHTKNFFLSLLVLSCSQVFAENIKFQNIRVGGTGCPSDITQIATAPDLSAASIIFQSFESHVPLMISGKGPSNISTLNCNVFIDIKLPVNQKLESLEVTYDMRGNTSLDQGVSGSFKSYLVSANGNGLPRSQGTQLLQEKNWLNTSIPQDEDFTIQTSRQFNLASNCGGQMGDTVSVHLQHQLSSQILSRVPNAQGTITMDSSDMSGGIRLRAITSACRVGGGQNPNPPGRNCRFVRINNRSQMICD